MCFRYTTCFAFKTISISEFHDLSLPVVISSRCTRNKLELVSHNFHSRCRKSRQPFSHSTWDTARPLRRQLTSHSNHQPRFQSTNQLVHTPSTNQALVFVTIAKLAKRKPGDHEVGEGEKWFMVDSGAGTNGAKCKRLFPDYVIQDYPAKTWTTVRGREWSTT